MAKRGFDRDFAVNVTMTAAMVARVPLDLLAGGRHFDRTVFAALMPALLMMVDMTLDHRSVAASRSRRACRWRLSRRRHSRRIFTGADVGGESGGDLLYGCAGGCAGG
ncbi:hypothetical protein [Lysobacter capsici]|uniref:hypothetical protein n=1 Tax=Lysobacter capsici TaxID=435897 RepID=UPI003D2F6A75